MTYLREQALLHRAQLGAMEKRLRQIHNELVTALIADNPPSANKVVKMLDRATAHIAEAIVTIDNITTEVPSQPKEDSEHGA